MGLFSKSKKKAEEEKLKQTVNNTSEQTSDSWICPKCSTKNQAASRSCKDCGYYR